MAARNHSIRFDVLVAGMLLLSAASLRAQPSAADSARVRGDTLRVVLAPPVHVEASSIAPRVARDAQPMAMVTRSQIVAANAVDLADAIAYAPGVFVKQYGGLGGLRTISLRGSSAQQSVILINGVRYRGTASDAFDLGNIPADALERVEVVRGGNAALFGANALGGVVNIVTGNATADPLAITARAAVGSFGEYRAGADAHGTLGRDAWQAGVHYTQGRGDYPFTFNEFGATSVVRRENADLTNLFGRAAWSHATDEGQYGVALQGFSSHRGVPGAVVQGSREQAHARLDEREIFGVAQWAARLGEWNVGVDASTRLNVLHYRDPDASAGGADGLDNRYDGDDGLLGVHGRCLIGQHGAIDLRAECGYAGLRGDNLDPGAGSTVERLSCNVAVASNWFWEEGLFGCETTIDAGLRGDLFSDLDPAISPAFGVVWRVGATPLRLRAHGALSFRAPSFTEQYYLNFGNRNLRPEHGASLDLGSTLELAAGVVIEGNLFGIDTRDAIIAVPRSPISWSAANIAHTMTRGAELAAAGALFDGLLSLRASYTRMHAEDRTSGPTYGMILPYVPEELFNGLADLRLGRVGFGFNWQFVSHRYSLSTNEYASMLPHYFLLGASASLRIDVDALACDLRFECTNLLDASYQVVHNYPMPGRTLRAEVVIRYR